MDAKAIPPAESGLWAIASSFQCFNRPRGRGRPVVLGGEFPDRARGRPRPRSPGSEENEDEGRRRGRLKRVIS
jgi:hypothetical protein